ncbi:MAG: ABC transporter substrate-binding protein [Aerococcaceae bacterium]|nr:ABC transporter substrate-binding protein [Aerococcaceae bacterium]
MKLLKKITVLVCMMLLLVPTLSATAEQKPLKIAIFQLVSHPSLDEITKGIKEGFAQNGYEEGKNLTIDFQNAQGDMTLLNTIAEQMIAKQPDVIFAITTPVAQTLQQKTTEIPIILAGITDPVGAKLVDSLEKPNANITGVSDAAPLEAQFELMLQLTPNVKTIGMLYSSSEDNSKSEIEKAQKIAESKGLTVVVETVASSSELPLIAENLASKVDAIFVPTDNLIASNFDILLNATDKVRIPVYPTVDAMVKQGGLASVGINQASIGSQSTEMALAVLNGTDIQTMPVQFAEKTVKVINSDTVKALNLQVDAKLLETLTDVKGE